ncbi:glycerate dehydrogenase [marine bacterium AO1-C]|nr:glycerate dehydrogenase [marine bacterium AO1-C]
MKIVVVDGHALNPGDLSWQPFENFGEVTVYARTSPEQLVERCQDADIVLTNKARFDRETLLELTHLKYIGVLATGYDLIDLETAKASNIVVTNIPAYGAIAVAQHTFALMLALINKVNEHDQSVKAGEWTNNPDWCYWKQPFHTLNGRRLGIIGFGKIGHKVAEVAKAFGMRMFYNNLSRKTNVYAQFAEYEEIFEKCDIVTLHLPLDDTNKGFVNKSLLSRMQKSAILINTSRGGLINEQDLADALNSGQIAGAGLDVLSTEPPAADNPLLSAKNVIITPHMAWGAVESRTSLMQTAIENVRSFIEGNPENVVNS